MRLIAIALTVALGVLGAASSACGQGTMASLAVSGVPGTLTAPNGFTMTISGSTGGARHAGVFPIYGPAPCAANVQAQLEASAGEYIAHPESDELPSTGFAGLFTIHPTVEGEAASSPGVYTLCVFMEAAGESEAVEAPEEESVIATASTTFTVLASPSSVSAPTPGAARRCIVPQVEGRTLAFAEKAVARAHCRVGRVRRKRSRHRRRGRVMSQGRRAGRALPNGSRVSLVVGAGGDPATIKTRVRGRSADRWTSPVGR